MNRNSKRLLITAVVILAVVIIGMILMREKRINTDITAKAHRVGLVVTGSRNDANFCQMHYDALMKLKDELNLEIICKEHIPEDETCSAAIDELIDKDGCTIIFAASFGYGPYVSEAAGKHPDVCFLHPFGNEKAANLTSLTGRMYQARYLSGIVAGMRTETGKIGYVAAFPYTEVIRDLNAFTLGVKSVAPDARVYVRYCYSWVDDVAAEKAGNELLDLEPDIDVITMHTNSLMPNRIAEERGIWAVGYNKDNAKMFPNSYLTACEWQWDIIYRKQILSCLQGKFYGTIEWLDMESGVLGLSELTGQTAPGTQEKVDEARKRFAGRSFDVFYGPIVDNTGILRVPDGESMSDDDLLNHFDWYVEGVIVEE